MRTKPIENLGQVVRIRGTIAPLMVIAAIVDGHSSQVVVLKYFWNNRLREMSKPISMLDPVSL